VQSDKLSAPLHDVNITSKFTLHSAVKLFFHSVYAVGCDGGTAQLTADCHVDRYSEAITIASRHYWPRGSFLMYKIIFDMCDVDLSGTLVLRGDVPTRGHRYKIVQEH